MAKQFVGREEILGLEEILGREEILGDVGAQNFVGRQEILGLEEILGNAALEEIVSSGCKVSGPALEEIVSSGPFVDGDEIEQARDGGSAEKKALARRLGRSDSCGYNSHWAHIRGESAVPSTPNSKILANLKAKVGENYASEMEEIRRTLWKSSYPVAIDTNFFAFLQRDRPNFSKFSSAAIEVGAITVDSKGRRVGFSPKSGGGYSLIMLSGNVIGSADDSSVKRKALDAIRPLAAQKAAQVLAAYQKDGTIRARTKKCIGLLEAVEAGDESAKARYQRRRAKALSGASHKSMDYWADLYAAAQLRKVLQQKGVKIAGDDVDGRRQAREILDAAANASPKQITKSNLKRAIDLWAGPQATKEEKIAVGAKMMAFIDKRKIKLA